ncbi:MAG TPA: SDR family NAD(P)-dependent oxidoreductase [Rhizomicrobium sp.]|nr:SDR family NAD(P)-dependent oxidoreductase [Rhizomicrobium sp.]
MVTTSKRVLVTGGSSGIGLAIAHGFADAGYDVTICGRDEQRLRDTKLRHVVFDVCDETATANALQQLGPIDVFVANAGGAETAPVSKMPRNMWDRMLALNLTSLFNGARAALPPMIARGWGRFIVVGSTASLKGYRYVSAYAAAKHGALGFVRSLALELAQTGVTANMLCPGYSDTPMIAQAIDTIASKTKRTREDAAATFTDANPMGRLIQPKEVAAAALWLASDAAGSVNGQAIAIDGGETA